jgi:hypothetical protein
MFMYVNVYDQAEFKKYDDKELYATNGMLSYLFEWGVDPSIDGLLIDELGFHNPWPPPSFAYFSQAGKVMH